MLEISQEIKSLKELQLVSMHFKVLKLLNLKIRILSAFVHVHIQNRAHTVTQIRQKVHQKYEQQKHKDSND